MSAKIKIIITLAVLVITGFVVFVAPKLVSKKEKTNPITITPSSTCLEKGTKQQFTASAEGVYWSVDPLFKSNPVGNIDQNGMFRASDTPSLGKVIATKGEVKGTANVSVVDNKLLCGIKKVVFKDSKKSADAKETGGVEEEPTGAAGGSFEGANVHKVWVASFDAKLKYEVRGVGEVAGFVTHKLEAGFWFTVDYASGKIEVLDNPTALAIVKVSDDVPTCQTTTVGDEAMLISGTDGKLIDKEINFGRNFIITNQKEGVKMTCMNYSFSEPSASVVDMLGQHAFPVSVELKDGASVPIQGSFTFVGRQATIDGVVRIRKETDF